MTSVYKGDQSFDEFLRLDAQGVLFERPITQRRSVVNQLAVTAAKVVDEIGRDAVWADIKDVFKTRIAGKVECSPDDVIHALDSALKVRQRV